MQDVAGPRSGLVGSLSRLWALWRDPATPWMLKLLPVLALVYAVVPLDVVPDALPLAGWIDDAVVLWAAVSAFLKRAEGRRRGGRG